MKITTIFLAMFLFLLNTPAVLTQDTAPSPIVVPATETFDLTSETNGHDYRLWIGLPENYASSDQSYPVLYLLDPGFSFLSVTEFVRFITWESRFPQLIVVGIGYPTDELDEIVRLREQDYYVQPDDFLEFISAELIPLIDSTYRTDPTDRALVGWSYGGAFVFHTLVSQPNFFSRYVAIATSPREITQLMQDEAALRSHFAGRNIRLFIAASGQELIGPAIQRREVEGLEVFSLSLGNVTHTQALHLGLPAGILAIYED